MLPEISAEGDVYRIGSLAAIRAIHDKANPFLPYQLNLFPVQRALIQNYVDKVAPLCLVQATELVADRSLMQNEEILYQFMLKTYNKLAKVGQDKKFREILQFMQG